MLVNIRDFLAVFYLICFVANVFAVFGKDKAKSEGTPEGVMKQLQYDSLIGLFSVFMFISALLLSILTLVR